MEKEIVLTGLWKPWDFTGEQRYGESRELRDLLLYKRISSWDKNKIVLEDGTVVTIEQSDFDCCAWAEGEFRGVELDAVITNVDFSGLEEDDADDVCNKSTITLFHNQNPIAYADMKAGHNGYYYSVGSLVIGDIHFPVVKA